mgnify:CR=1 FL=1
MGDEGRMSLEFDRQALVSIFTAEASDGLDKLSAAVSGPESDTVPAPDVMHQLFIVAHSLKGAAALYGYETASALAGILEKALRDEGSEDFPFATIVASDGHRTTRPVHLDEAARLVERYGDWTIVVCRPVPVLAEASEGRDELLASLPNLPDPQAPDGETEEDNVTLSEVGKPRNFGFEPSARKPYVCSKTTTIAFSISSSGETVFPRDLDIF